MQSRICHVKLLFLFISTISFSIPCFSQEAISKPSVHLASIPFPMHWDNAPAKYKVTGNTVIIEAGKETDIYGALDGSYYINNVPRLLFRPDSNFIFSARVQLPFDSLYDGGALIMYSDSANWAKLLFERSEKNVISVGSTLVRERMGDDSYHTIIMGKQVFLKMAKAGIYCCFYYSADGIHWNLLRTFSYPKIENMKIGFYAQSPLGPGCAVEFSAISYRGKKFTNLVSGE